MQSVRIKCEYRRYTLQHSRSLTRERRSVEIDAIDDTVGGPVSGGSSFLYNAK